MNKSLRIVVSAIILIGVVFLARNQMAWAGILSDLNSCGRAQDGAKFAGCAFDFGTGTSPLENGYARVTETTAYSSGAYGWTDTSGLESQDHSVLTQSLNRDLVMESSAPRTFRVDIPSGTYVVTLTMGDNDLAHDNMLVKANGVTMLENVNTAAGAYAINSFNVTVAGGYLELEFSDAGSGSDPAWVVNALTIVPVTVAPVPAGLPGPNPQPGTVKPPPVVVPPVTGPGTYSVGGICTFRVITLAGTISLHADVLPFSTLGTKPENIAGYVAGVCRATYVEKTAGVMDVVGASDGQIEVCFAAIPNTTVKIYVYVDKTKTWTALETTVQNGLACAPAQRTGKYVLVTEQ